MANEWASPDHALAYLERADGLPHRAEGEAVVIELLPEGVSRFLDLGAGDGRLLALALTAHPGASGVALDFSPTMLDAARARFSGNESVAVVEHDLSDPLPDVGSFDAVVSSFAIHHLEDGRKRELYSEIFDLLEPDGIFCNLEHVSSPTPELSAAFYQALGAPREVEEDPSNRCIPAEVQVRWLTEIGFLHADCYWKWREMALLAGLKPGGERGAP